MSTSESIKCFNQIFKLNTKIELHGLNAQQLNGKEGVITAILNEKNSERYGVLIDGKKKSIAVKPINLMTKHGVAPVFVFEKFGFKIPCRAILGVNQYYNEIAVVITCSDHMGLDALIPVRDKFFGKNVDLKDIVGEQFDALSTALVEYRNDPGEIAIAMYKNAKKDLAKCMEKNGLIQFTQKTITQGYGEFSIAKICFQSMFYHNVN